MKTQDSYTVIPFPKLRRFSIDNGAVARGKNIVHGLLEVDVTNARQYLREHKARTGESLSFTAFIISCLAQAVQTNKAVQAYHNWRDQLVIYDDVNVNTIVEIEAEAGREVAMPYIVRAANQKTFREIHQELRAAKRQPTNTRELKFMEWFLILPGPIRRFFYWLIMQNPQWTRGFTSPVLVTSVGMFGKGGAWWGIPNANFALTVTLGGVAEKPGIVEGRIEIREYLCLTLSFDHAIVDGAPAARFGQQFKELIECAYGLDDHNVP
jgi:pyruvate/2-oxoglutarate dehydrogenase complex dihydrolipoamide acyltransferase (E2) component